MTVLPTWHRAIENDESFSALNETTTEFIAAIGKGLSSDELWTVVRNNPGSAIIFKIGPNAVAVAHQLTALGGSIANPEKAIVGVIGKDLISACGFLFDRPSLVQEVEFVGPTQANITGATNAANWCLPRQDRAI